MFIQSLIQTRSANSEHAVRILHQLEVFSPSAQPSVLPAEQSRGIQEECARRTFWLIHLIELLGAIFTRRPTSHSLKEVAGIRLPCDESSFEYDSSSTPAGERNNLSRTSPCIASCVLFCCVANGTFRLHPNIQVFGVPL